MNEPLPAVCPKCSSPRSPGGQECPRCGVIYSRAQPSRPGARPARPAARPAVAEPPEVASPAACSRPGGYVSPAHLETAFTLLSQALETGLPLTTFVHGPGAACLPPAYQRQLQRDIQQGLPLSESLASMHLVDPGALALVQAGERHGRLPEALHQVAERLGERRKDRDKLVLTLLYPCILLAAAALVLPLPTLFSQGLGPYLAKALPLLLAIGGLGVFALVILPRFSPDSPLRRTLRAAGSSLPLVSTVVWSGAVARFAEVLGTSLHAGLPTRESIQLASRAAAHPRFEQAHRELVDRLDSGSTLSEAIAAVRGLEPMFLSQLGAGERSGTLDVLLPKVAADYRRRARTAALVLVGVIGGLAFVGVMALLAFSVIQGWQGIFQGRGQAVDRLIGH